MDNSVSPTSNSPEESQRNLSIQDENLLETWRTEIDIHKKRRIMTEMKKRSLFPDDDVISKLIEDGGLYPDVEDPNFVSRLLKKSEFADTYSFAPSANETPCAAGPDFEVTPVQRFVANFLHPRTPYMSALLYHGVGVGKTCAAIQTAEAYLDVYPRRKIIIVAPPTIQGGFMRTIFDMERLVIGKGNEPNYINGCTGDTYLRLVGGTYERDRDVLDKRIKMAIKRRYEFYGYLAFRNHIRNVLKKISMKGDDEVVRLRRIEALKKEFNYRLLIIDEAHNLRDVASTDIKEESEEVDTVGTEEELEEAKAGKLLTPYLHELLDSIDGLKLLLMTATPMFNDVREIVLLLNLLLRNDKKSTITLPMIFNPDGSLLKGADLILKPIANAYVSFMRGENPNSFPLRLLPKFQRITAEDYPPLRFSGVPFEEEDTEPESMSNLPLINSECPEGSKSHLVMTELTEENSKRGTSYMIIDSLLQAGNCVFPVDAPPSECVGLKGFQNVFTRRGKGFEPNDSGSWLTNEEFSNYSPKGATILHSLKNSEGVGFVYSRFVTTGALLLALALEANGYTIYGRSNGLLANGNISPGGHQCAKCPLREAEHAGADHDLVPARYVILTGDKDISPNNKDTINVARSEANKNGELVKVVLGSQIAGEGLDLRFIREVHILDAWFHLNKTEQIVGRGIRFCSHSLLDIKKRNTTVFLHTLTIPGFEKETADLYCYRNALRKAILVGQVSRMLKTFAVDCNLRKEVTVLRGLGRRVQIDSQGGLREREDDDDPSEKRGIRIDDMNFTAMCDWMECPYTCDPSFEVNLETSDISTYNTFSSRYRETKLQRIIQAMFARQILWSKSDMLKILESSEAPRAAIDMTIQGILNNRLFRIKHGSREGYVIYKNGYFIFQPDSYKDDRIPLALRIADFPIKQDDFSPDTLKREIYPTIIEEVKEQIEPQLWEQLVKWVDGISNGTITTVGIDIERQIEKYTPDFKQQRKVYTDKLSMILLLSKRIPDKEMFRQIVLEYIWDEWLDIKTQHFYCLSGDETITSIAKETIITSGTTTAYRFVNPENNQLQLLCKDGPCSSGVIEAFSKLSDSVKERKADVKTTGSIYGFVVPKRGIMVFKSHIPHKVGEIKDGDTVKGGQECIIVTSKEYMLKLITVGNELTKAGENNLNFDKDHLSAPAEISNSTRGCTLLNLVLRYMDLMEIGEKRWFFRPLAAFYSGHRGKISQEARKASEAEQKNMKKRKAEAKKEEKKTVAAEKKTVAANQSVKKRLTLVKPLTVVETSKEVPKPRITILRKPAEVPVQASPLVEPKPRVTIVRKPAPVEEPTTLFEDLNAEESEDESPLIEEVDLEAPVAAPVAEESENESPLIEEVDLEAPVVAPIEVAPIEVAPIEVAPIEVAPIEKAPIEEAPIEEAPIEEAPIEEAPIEEAPQAPVIPKAKTIRRLTLRKP